MALTLEYADKLKPLGKSFCVIHMPWLPKHIFDIELPKERASNDPLARFKDDNAYDLATAEDLLIFIPEKYHEDMKGLSDFRDMVQFLWLNFISTFRLN